ncbi:EFR1 family ferrodoxin [Carboxylicivirga sediminis]|uniref:EFR1 family ferrodoxin n=1 Tax=Carboxylicivirga sediminis TaxID=2006564 RepID=A0A941F7U6_9BACT|nr:EFR1 family ferrodoxin [Carboxylicivirga sediminis]MBR8537214.1 EFR1 family ferrodoxin [Carboxylicivirga sediminis]
MQILYFTATGNSLHIAKSLGGELLSIPQMIKAGRYDFTDDKIGIVFPLHAWGVPSYVVDFLKKVTFNSNYLFAVTTYGIYSGAVAKHLTDIGNEAGFWFDYINRIKMVDNYLPTFDMKKEMEKEPKKQIEKQLAAVKSDIDASKKWILKESFIDKAMFNYMAKRGNKPFNEKRLKVHVYGEGIENYMYIEDSCTQCGMCAKVCPVDNIKMDTENGKIVLSDKCFMCFACIHHCPSNAIHIKGEVNSNRFRNSNIKLSEIVKANS